MSYYWYMNRQLVQDINDARYAGELESYWEGDTQDLYHQQQLEQQEQEQEQ